MKSRRDQGLTAVELIVVIVVAGIGAAVTVPALLRAGRNDRLATCESNLRALWKLDADLRAKGGALPSARGSAYWEKVAADSPNLATCPLSGLRYRGPIADPGSLPPGAPVAADAPGAHGAKEGGNVLFKIGEIRAVRELDGVWKAAAEQLAP
jgi:prepilin-type N-terminal cleavage/methylation domain-containing protein